MGDLVLVAFGRVMPEEFAAIAPLVDIEFEMQRLDPHQALQAMQPGTGGKDRRGVGLGPALAHQLGVAHPGKIADPGQQAAGAFLPQGADQLAPQGTKGGGVYQQHALVVEPDAAIAGGEEQALGQFRLGRAGAAIPGGTVATLEAGSGLLQIAEGQTFGTGHGTTSRVNCANAQSRKRLYLITLSFEQGVCRLAPGPLPV